MVRVGRIAPVMLLLGILLALVLPGAAGAGDRLVPPGDDGAPTAPVDAQDGAHPAVQDGAHPAVQDGEQGGDGAVVASPAVLPPIITLWYGSTQNFGTLGNPQLEINILGNVAKAETLSYKLNGTGSFKPLAIGRVTPSGSAQQMLSYLPPWESLNQVPEALESPVPSGPASPDITASPRLEYTGDFNCEILTADLLNGPNTVELKAVGDGGETTRIVTVNYTQGNTWPLPYSIDWSTVGDITQVAQIVEGEWELGASSIRPKLYGYDRMIALGDVGWTDYQVTVPVTIHDFPNADSGGVGIVNRWQGHFQVGDEQPGAGWWNIGAYALFLHRDDANGGRRLIMYTGRRDPLEDGSGYLVNKNKVYMFKLRVQTKEAGKSGFYSFKVWAPTDESEPSSWVFEAQDAPPEEMFSGGTGLIAHDIDASFGNVEILPVLKVNTTIVGGGAVNVTPALVGPSAAYLYGDQIQLQAVAQPGWAFAGWSGDLDGNASPKSVTLTSNLNVTATFVEGQAFRLDATASGAGTVELDPAGPWYAEGTVVELTPVASTGWEFGDWSGADAGALTDNHDGTWSVTMSEDRSVSADFVRKRYALTVNVSGQGTVAKSPNETTYEHGTQVQLTPDPAAGWTFTGWSGDLTGSASPENILMDGPKTVTAHFGDADVGPLEYDNHTLDDDQVGPSDGNSDGEANCGETIEMSVLLANRGTEAATGVNAALATDSAHVSWPGSSTSSYVNIAGGGSQANTTAFGFKVADNAPNGHTITFELSMSSTNGGLHYDSFDVPVACANSEGTVDRQVDDSDDDAEERQYGKVYLGGTDLELVEDDDGPQTVGVRFQNITIPQGTAIAEAYLEFTADEEGSRTTNLIFNCQATDNAPAFQGEEWSISSLPKSTTSVVWNRVPAWIAVGERHQTPNLAPIVQEIVNRGGWQSGNALAFLITGEGTRTAESYDGNRPSEAPRLHVVYGREPVCYNLNTSAVPASGGSITRTPAPNCGGNKYIEGTQVTLTATGSPGWSYTGWSGDLSGTTNPVSISMDGEKSVTANFVQAQYLLNVSIVGPGTVTKEPDKATYTYGEQVKLTAQATGDSVFAGWSGALSGTTNPAWLTMNGHKSVTAVFGQVGPLAYDSHVIDDDGTGASSGNGDAFVDCGETVEMSVTLLNQGSAAAEGVNATLSETDPYVISLGNTTSSYGSISGLGTAANVTKYDFEVSADTPHLHSVTFSLNAAASNGGPWPIQFQVPISCLANAGKVDKAVVQSSDDAEELISNGLVAEKGSDLELGEDDLGPQWVGLRFQNLIIPQGAAISEAYVEFTAAQTDAGATTVLFHGQASDNPPAFAGSSQNSPTAEGAGLAATAPETSAYDISSRLKTAASVTWTAVPTWSVGQTYKSPNLAPVIQEIVDRTGWGPGNSLALLINGTGRRTAFSYDGEPALAPRLMITFGGDLTCYTLSTTVDPAGSGTVTPQPAANCGADKYLEGTSVQLVPEPALDHTFTGWSGDLTGSDNPATLVMNDDKQVTAGFRQETCYTLTTGVNFPGTGTLSANPEPNCGGGKYVAGTNVTLTAAPQEGYVFDGWTGPVPPSTDNPLTVTVDADKTVTANFVGCFSLTAIGLPFGTGTVEADPPPNCGAIQYRGGSQVQLTAVPAPGYAFTTWTGGATGTDNPATVTMIADMVVTAGFETGTCRTLSLRAAPTGAGTVSASPPPDCEGTKYSPGLRVDLTATPRAGYKFLGWSGAATGTANPTTIIMGNVNTATAEFGLIKIESTLRLPIMAR